jgi:GDP-L-fucose synthase
MTDFWKNKRVAVTGATGFIGSHVVDRLVTDRGVERSRLMTPTHGYANLQILEQATAALSQCDVLLHVAADVGAAGYSSRHPATQLYHNTLMDLQVLEAARLAGIGRVLLVGCVVMYSGDPAIPLTESRALEGPLAESAAGIGQGKRNALVAAGLYHREFGLNVSVVVPSNAYGSRDELVLARAHVVPATILKCLTLNEVVSMGNPETSRDFAYVEDVAEGILLAAERLPAGEHVNLGSGAQTTIGDLVKQCVTLTGFRGSVRFDGSGPKVPKQRPLDIARARDVLGYRPTHDLESGLAKTIEWYRENVGRGT